MMKNIFIDIHDFQSDSESIDDINMNKSKYKIKGIVNVRKAELNKIGYNDFKQWIANKDNIYIGRNMTYYVPGAVGSIWGNPFPVSDRGYSLEESLEKYKQYIESKPDLINKLKELDGKVLGCWCKTSDRNSDIVSNKPKKCHGDILAELVEKYNN